MQENKKITVKVDGEETRYNYTIIGYLCENGEITGKMQS